MNFSGGTETVPAKPSVAPAQEYATSGKTIPSVSAASRMQKARAIIVSVPMGMCGPCISTDPAGMSAVRPPRLRYASTSVVVSSSRNRLRSVAFGLAIAFSSKTNPCRLSPRA